MDEQPRLRVDLARSADDMADVFAVRRAVFIDEQGVPEVEEIDAYDLEPDRSRAVYVMGRLGQRAIATGRLLLDQPQDEYPHVGRVAVLKEDRSKGYGRAVMFALHEEARKRGAGGITLAAQLHAVGFYERLGYIARGGVFL